MRTRLGVGCVLSLIMGCGFDIPPQSYVTRTEIAVVRGLVVELGPLYPDRVGPTFSYDDEMPIAEVLPGDRVLFDTVVIDVDGVPLAVEDVETMWLQCGVGPCSRWTGGFASKLFDVPCSEVPMYSTDSYCTVGTGTGQFEFIVPELGFNTLFEARMSFYGVAAWNGRRAADCWDQRRSDKQFLDGCEFVYHYVSVGPAWWLLQYADSIGLFSSPDGFPTPPIPTPANRIPRAPELTIRVDGEPVAQGRPPLPTINAQPGASIEIRLTFDFTSQLLQGMFLLNAGDVYTYMPETVASHTLTTGAIRHRVELVDSEYDEPAVLDDGVFRYDVDPFMPPGISRVLIVWHDDRGANEFLTVEFAVE